MEDKLQEIEKRLAEMEARWEHGVRNVGNGMSVGKSSE